MASLAIGINARHNGVDIAVSTDDVLGLAPNVDLVLIGDLVYEPDLATRVARFLEAAERHRSGLEQVSAMGRAYVAFSQEFPVLFDALARCELKSPEPTEGSPSEQACALGGDRLQGALVASIEAGVRDGSIRSDIGSPMLMSITLWGFMHGIIQLTTTKAYALTHHGVAAKALIDHAISMITRDLKS